MRVSRDIKTVRGSTTFLAFEPRRVVQRGTATMGDTILKRYAIMHGNRSLDHARFESAMPLVSAELPSPASLNGRAGAGFLILHQGLTGDYVVLAWWDRENELPLRVWIRDDGEWRPARGGESICVWDLEIIWFERQAWVATALAGGRVSEAVPAYAERWFCVPARG